MPHGLTENGGIVCPPCHMLGPERPEVLTDLQSLLMVNKLLSLFLSLAPSFLPLHTEHWESAPTGTEEDWKYPLIHEYV